MNVTPRPADLSLAASFWFGFISMSALIGIGMAVWRWRR